MCTSGDTDLGDTVLHRFDPVSKTLEISGHLSSGAKRRLKYGPPLRLLFRDDLGSDDSPVANQTRAILIGCCGVALAFFCLFAVRGNFADSHWPAVGTRFSAWHVFQAVPLSVWQGFWPLATIVAAALIAGSGPPGLCHSHGPRTSCCHLHCSRHGAGRTAMVEGVARMSPFFSLAEPARFLNEHGRGHGEVIFEGALHQGSSLVFYLRQKFYLVNRPDNDDSFVGTNLRAVVLEESDVLEKWADPEPVYLIVDQTRVPYWQKIITDRFHIFHQVTASGSNVILSNEL